MSSHIVVANRTGLASAPDGSKHRLAAGRTMADDRHPLVQAYPDLFSPYTIDLPYEGDDVKGGTSPEGSEDLDDLRGSLASVKAVAEGYRAQLGAIAEGLYARGLVPADIDTDREGWLAELISDILDRSRVEDPATEPEGKLPEVSPDALPKPRKRAARPRPAAGNE